MHPTTTRIFGLLIVFGLSSHAVLAQGRGQGGHGPGGGNGFRGDMGMGQQHRGFDQSTATAQGNATNIGSNLSNAMGMSQRMAASSSQTAMLQQSAMMANQWILQFDMDGDGALNQMELQRALLAACQNGNGAQSGGTGVGSNLTGIYNANANTNLNSQANLADGGMRGRGNGGGKGGGNRR